MKAWKQMSAWPKIQFVLHALFVPRTVIFRSLWKLLWVIYLSASPLTDLPLNAKPTYFLELQTEELRNTFKNFVPIILTLSGASEINIIEANDKAPSGCAVNILNERVKLHIFLKVSPSSYVFINHSL